MTTVSVNDKELQAFVDRIERLEEEKATIGGDIKDVYTELKGVGYIPKIVRKIVRDRKRSKAERQEEEALIDLYENALKA